ncbi:UDP-glucose 4-epimerase GalE [Aestuariivirga sp.]|uniref:UDP-glucose 4-epimerase GalE n=1 Tax=Aestuariivirga sp. TaxID=2650926 RepID=UPI003BAB70CA
MLRRRVLVTGGAGYIGSHTAKLLHGAGVEPIVYDNLSTGNRPAVRWGPFVQGDILDTAQLTRALINHRPEAVIHFAASAYVGESVEDPSKYYRNNVSGTASLLEACHLAGVDKLIFSSSCAVYGVPNSLPIRETTVRQPINPYGRTKLIGEHMLEDYATAYKTRYVALRYFNACGADPDGELGEWHSPETHLIPKALMAAAGLEPSLRVFGDDYDTADGTCIRDFIHVVDLARAHVMALDHLNRGGASLAVNIGTGTGTSIRDILSAIARVTGRQVPIEMCPRRPGDPPSLFADTALAQQILGFEPRYSDLDTIVRTASRFFSPSQKAA